jgi:hypothetical protein
MDARKKAFGDTVKENFQGILDRDQVIAFYEYWIQPNPSQTKMGFELCKTWDIKARMRTWKRNNEKRKPNYKTPQPKAGVAIANT